MRHLPTVRVNARYGFYMSVLYISIYKLTCYIGHFGESHRGLLKLRTYFAEPAPVLSESRLKIFFKVFQKEKKVFLGE